MALPERGEFWLADLGMAAKTRPVLVVSVPYSDSDYALIGVIPHTTTPRGSQFEIVLRTPSLQPGAFNVQGMLAVPAAKFIRRLGTASPDQLAQVEAAVRRWLGLIK